MNVTKGKITASEALSSIEEKLQTSLDKYYNDYLGK